MRKRNTLFFVVPLIILALLFAGYYGWTRWNHAATPCGAGNFTILCMGDSITAEGYPAVLSKILKRHGYKNFCVRNLGRKGNNSGEYLRYLRKHPELLNGRVNMVLLQLGTNDVRIDHDHTDIQAFMAHIRQIVEIIRERQPKAHIYLGTIPPILKDVPGYFDKTSRQRVRMEINPQIAVLAHRLHCVRVDVYRAFKGHPEWVGRDGIHPTKAGTRELAKVYFRAIQPGIARILGVIHVTLPPGFHDRVVFQSDVEGDTEIYLLTKKGLHKLTDNTYPDEYPVASPDGKKILYMTKPGKTWELAIYFLGRKKSKIVLNISPYNTYVPAWCPDGTHIVFATDKWGKSELALYNLKTCRLTRLTDTIGKNTLPDCAPDGRTIVFTGNRGFGWHIYKLDLKSGKIVRLTHKRGNCRPHVSPDGKWIAFVKENHGKSDIFLMRPDGTGMHSLTKDPGHWEYYPAWSRDGKRVYFSKSIKHRGAPWHLWVINADGTHAFRITNGFSKDRFANAF